MVANTGSTQLWVSAGLSVTEGTAPERACQALLKLTAYTQQEPGCLRFELLQHQQPGRFTLWEGWVNEAALQAHYEAEHTQAYFALGLTEVDYLERLQPPMIGPQEGAQ